MLTVVDASAWLEYLLGTAAAEAFRLHVESEATDLHVPALCDVELVSGLRRCIRESEITSERAQAALEDYLDLPITRHGHTSLISRILELRNNFSSYDATYAALAESLGARFVSADERFVRAMQAHLPGVLIVGT